MIRRQTILLIALLIVGCDILQEEDVYGCTDSNACNFNADANIYLPNSCGVLDNCGTCDSDATNDCVMDCAGVAGGDSVEDVCGVCGGDESSCNVISTNDYNFLYDRYFFIDDRYRNNFYPLTENYQHQYDSTYVVGNFEVYKKVYDFEGDPILATAYINPLIHLETDSVRGYWKRLDEYVDYDIGRMFGYIRINSSTAQNEIAIAYTTTSYDEATQTFGTDQVNTGTNFKHEYIDCLNNNQADPSPCEYVIKLKLIKATDTKSSPSSPTWNLMFKNVYSLGGSNIEPSTLEVEIVRDESANLQTSHSDNGNSYLSIFGLDSEDQTKQKFPEGCDNITIPCTGDGKIDLYESIINFQYGVLILPAHLPFAYDESAEFGNNHNDLNGILPELNETDGSPTMYFDTNTDNKVDEHEFVIKIIINN